MTQLHPGGRTVRLADMSPRHPLFAWIVGWDLVPGCTVPSATVALGRSHYFQELIGILDVEIPHRWGLAPFGYDPAVGQFVSTGASRP